MNIDFAEETFIDIFQNGLDKVTIIGEFAYVNLGGPIRAKIELTEAGFDINILSLSAGLIDKRFLSFFQILGEKPSTHPERSSITPRIFIEKDVFGLEIKTQWYDYIPTEQDCQTMFDAIHRYISVFKTV